MLMLASNVFEPRTVNSPHLRKPENAEVTEASKLSRSSRLAWLEASNNCLRIAHVIGSLGFLSRSPMYLLIPLMTCWSRGDSQAENGRSASMCAEHRWVMYDLMVLGCTLWTPPSHETHSSRADCDAGKIGLSGFLNCGYRMMKSVNNFCPVL